VVGGAGCDHGRNLEQRQVTRLPCLGTAENAKRALEPAPALGFSGAAAYGRNIALAAAAASSLEAAKASLLRVICVRK
jgi:hypothetical protein